MGERGNASVRFLLPTSNMTCTVPNFTGICSVMATSSVGTCHLNQVVSLPGDPFPVVYIQYIRQSRNAVQALINVG